MISIISFPGNIKIPLSYNPYHTKNFGQPSSVQIYFPRFFKCHQNVIRGSNAGFGSNSPWPKGQLSSGSNTRGQSLVMLKRRVESLKVYVL